VIPVATTRSPSTNSEQYSAHLRSLVSLVLLASWRRDGSRPLCHLIAVVPGVVGVGGVFREKGADGPGVLATPNSHVGVEPYLQVIVGHCQPPPAPGASSDL
jgi:hypothetical protein